MSKSGLETCTSTVWLSTLSMPMSAPKPPNGPTAKRMGTVVAVLPTARMRRSTRIEAGARTTPRMRVFLPPGSSRYTRDGSGSDTLPVPA